MQKFIGGIGCFWDETKYEDISGIISTECGYCGGKSKTTSYEQVCGGNTEHIEVVKVEFNPAILSYEKMIRLFFKFHDFDNLIYFARLRFIKNIIRLYLIILQSIHRQLIMKFHVPLMPHLMLEKLPQRLFLTFLQIFQEEYCLKFSF